MRKRNITLTRRQAEDLSDILGNYLEDLEERVEVYDDEDDIGLLDRGTAIFNVVMRQLKQR